MADETDSSSGGSSEGSSGESIPSVLMFHNEEFDDESSLDEADYDNNVLNFADLSLSDDKQDYVKDVKNALNSDEFITFKGLILLHRTKRIGSIKFRRHARRVLKNHTELIPGLNIFLPKEIHIADCFPTEDSNKMVMDFFRLVQKRCGQGYMERIPNLLKIIKNNMSGRISQAQMNSQIAALFQGHPELVNEF